MKADFQKHFGALIDPAIPSEKNHWLNFRFLGKVAASVLIVVSVGTASYYIGTRHNQPKSAALAYFETTTPMGAQTKVVLPDQSVVWVNAGSTLRYGSDSIRTDVAYNWMVRLTSRLPGIPLSLLS